MQKRLDEVTRKLDKGRLARIENHEASSFVGLALHSRPSIRCSPLQLKHAEPSTDLDVVGDVAMSLSFLEHLYSDTSSQCMRRKVVPSWSLIDETLTDKYGLRRSSETSRYHKNRRCEWRTKQFWFLSKILMLAPCRCVIARDMNTDKT